MMKAARKPVSAPGPGLGGGVLVDPAWLAAHLHDPAVRVIEVDVAGSPTTSGTSTGRSCGMCTPT